MKYIPTIFLVLVITVLVGSCSYRLGTICGYYDSAMPLQTCLKGPPFVKKP